MLTSFCLQRGKMGELWVLSSTWYFYAHICYRTNNPSRTKITLLSHFACSNVKPINNRAWCQGKFIKKWSTISDSCCPLRVCLHHLYLHLYAYILKHWMETPASSKLRSKRFLCLTFFNRSSTFDGDCTITKLGKLVHILYNKSRAFSNNAI